MHSHRGELHHIYRPKKRITLPVSFLISTATWSLRKGFEKKLYIFIFGVIIVGVFLNLFLFFENSRIKGQLLQQDKPDSSYIEEEGVIQKVKEAGRSFVVRLENENLVSIFLTKDTLTKVLDSQAEVTDADTSPLMDLINLGPGVKIKIKYLKSDFSQEHEFPVSEFSILL